MSRHAIPLVILSALCSIGWVPSSIGHVDSETHPLRCYYEYAESEADCPGVLELFGQAWDFQVGELGFAAPETDETGMLGIYLTDDDTMMDGFADCINYQDNTMGDGRTGCVAFVALDYRMNANRLEVFVEHEFNHVLQYSTDFNEGAEVFWEGAACVFDLLGNIPGEVYVTDTTDFQSNPWVGLSGIGRYLQQQQGSGEYYEYGGVAWWMHLIEHYSDGSPQIVADLWNAMAQEGYPNEPDYIDAYEIVTGNWQEAFLSFSEERVLMGTSYHPSWAEYTNQQGNADVSIGLADDVSFNDLPTSVSPRDMPFETGAVYVRINDVPADTTLLLEIEGETGVTWGVVASSGGEGSHGIGESITATSQGDWIILGAVNLGRPDFDPDGNTTSGSQSFPGSLEQWDVVLNISDSNGVVIDPGNGGDAGADAGTDVVGGTDAGIRDLEQPDRSVLSGSTADSHEDCGCTCRQISPGPAPGNAVGFILLSALVLFWRRESRRQ